MYQFSGVNTITFYAVEIFQDTGTTMNKTTCTIMLGVVRLIFTIIACIAMRKFGRRTLTFISGNDRRDAINKESRKTNFYTSPLRYWMRCYDDWTRCLSLLPTNVEDGRSTNWANCYLVPRGMHFHIHHHLYIRIFGGAVGNDRWTVSTESSWYRGWYDNMYGTYFCIPCR